MLLLLLAAVEVALHLFPSTHLRSEDERPRADDDSHAAHGNRVRSRPGPEPAGAHGNWLRRHTGIGHTNYARHDWGLWGEHSWTASGSITVRTDGAAVNGLKVSRTIVVAANNVTIENAEVSTFRQFGIVVNSGHTGPVIRNVTIHGADTTVSGEVQMGSYNDGDFDAVSVDRVDFYNGERILDRPGTLTPIIQ